MSIPSSPGSRPLRLSFPAAALVAVSIAAGGCGDTLAPEIPSMEPQLAVLVPTTDPPRLAASNFASCGLRLDGVVNCWSSGSEAPASKTAAAGAFVQITMGAIHGCGLRSDGVVECWGVSISGSAPATKGAATGTFVEVDGGREHTCAVRSDGKVECWGNNTQGQAPALVTASSGRFAQVGAGEWHTCGLRRDGVVECWGLNTSGQAPATKTAASGRFRKLAVGWTHGCALRDDGVVECWGPNSDGEAPATKTAASGSFKSVSAGTYHTCAIRNDGIVECWGSNSHDEAPATRAPATGKFTQLGLGAFHSCAMRADAFVECWGRNDFGQASLPAAPAPPTNVTAVGAGDPVINWTPASGTGWFRLYRKAQEVGAKWQLLDESLPAAQTSVSDPTAQVNVKYRYAVAACNFGGCSLRVQTGLVTRDVIPTKPTNVVAESWELGAVTVSWNAVAGAMNYQVQRRHLDDGTFTAWSLHATVNAPDDQFEEVVSPSISYQYRVRACNAAGCGLFSTVVNKLPE